jgi:zinc transport system substrate-binding protein
MQIVSLFMRKRFFPLLSFLSAIGVFLLFPPADPVSAQQPDKLRVITTLFPLQEFARAVGGESVHADLLLPPGAEAHTWDPKPSDIAKIAKADLFIYIGPMMEPWAAKVIKAANNPNLQVLAASRGLDLIEVREHESGPKHSRGKSPEGHLDPHIWLDFSLDMKIVDSIAAVFGTADPQNASGYKSRAESYKEKLSALDQMYQEGLSKCRQRQIFIGGHSAFAYLVRRYNLEQVALYGISPNAEPTPKKLAATIKSAQKQNAKYIFFEILVNPKLAQILAKEAGIGTLVLQTGHNLTKDQWNRKTGFLDMMESNLENLRRGLECHGP